MDDEPSGVDVQWDWTPHEGQRAILNSPARFRIVACGRRWGKTESAAVALLTASLEQPDTHAWWVAPTYTQADEGWTVIRDFLPERLLADVSRSRPRTLRLVNGSRLGFRSADQPDTLRGAGLDALVIDEAAMVSKTTWTNALRPTLSDTGGWLLAISTPGGGATGSTSSSNAAGRRRPRVRGVPVPDRDQHAYPGVGNRGRP